MAIFKGTAGDDDLTGTSGNDRFILTKGGNDTASGGGGNDSFFMGATLTASDRLDGGSGTDVLNLKGDYSAGLVLAATTIVNIEKINFDAGFDYGLTMNDGNVAAGQRLTVNAGGLGSANHLVFDGSAETDGSYAITGGAGDDTLTGGALRDVFNLARGGNDVVNAGGGNDTIVMNGALTAADRIDGGAGSDVMSLDGNYTGANAVVLGAATMTNVETLQFLAGHNYVLTSNDANVAAGTVLTVDASALVSNNSLTFNGAAETDGRFAFIGGAGDDVLTGGNAGNTFDLTHGGRDVATGGLGTNVFNLGAAFDTGDRINGAAGGSNTLILNGAYSGLTVSSAMAVNIQTLEIQGNNALSLIWKAVPALTLDASAAGGSLAFNFSTESSALHFIGGALNTLITGGSGADIFDAGSAFDSFSGRAGNDTFNFGANLTTGDSVDGGTGSNTLTLNGDYSAGLTFNAATMTNVQTLTLFDGHSYALTTNDATVGAGQTLSVNAGALGAGRHLVFNGSAETDGAFSFTGGAGSDTITGGAQADSFDLTHGGNDIAHGGGGNDVFTLGATLTAADQIDGGTGTDTLSLNGDYSAGLTFGAATITGIETLQLAAGHSYGFTTNDATVASGQTLTVNAGALGAGDTLTVNGAAETDGSFAFIGGAGNDTLTGGAQADTFDLSHGGTDIAHGGGGNDVFSLGAAFTASDGIDGGAGNDTLVLSGDYSAGLTFGATTMTAVEMLQFAGGHSYSLTLNDANVAAGQNLTLDGSALGASDALAVSGAAETDGSFAFIGGAGNDALTGGALADTFDLSKGGADTVHGDAGNDAINVGGALTQSDQIDGGTGTDTLVFNGDYSAGLTLGFVTVVNVETFQFASGHSYNLTTNDNTVTAGQVLTVDGSALGASDTLVFNGAAETDAGFAFFDGAGTYTFTGGAQADAFDLSHGGNDTAHGGYGNDIFMLGAALTAADSIDGGAGTDTLVLGGDYSSGFTFGAATISNIETLQLIAGHSYSFTTNDANIAAGQTLTVDGGALGAGDALTFNGAAETDGSLAIIGGAGNDTLTGGSQADSFDLSHGGSDTAHGGDGNDTFVLGGALTAADAIDGGTGSDTLILNGDYSSGFTFGASTIANIETIQLAGGHSYGLTTNDADVAAGALLTVDGSGLGAGDALTVNGAAETDGSFAFIGGAGNDTLTGGAQADTFDLTHGGSDTAHGGGGNDLFIAGGAFTASDSIDGGAGNDTLVLSGDYAGGLTFSAGTIANVETIQLVNGFIYNLSTNDANVASGGTLAIDGSTLSAGSPLTFDGSNETDGSFAIIGGAGNDTLTGGAQADTFDLTFGGSDTVHGGGGNDLVTLGAGLAADSIDGGAGTDKLILNGDYSSHFTFGAATISNIETLQLIGGHSYNFTSNDASVASGQTLTIDGGMLGTGDTLTFNGAAETDGSFAFVGGAGGDVLTGGNAGNTFDLTHGGTDIANGGQGVNVFNLGFTLDSSDHINGAAGASNTLILNGPYESLAVSNSMVANIQTVDIQGSNTTNIIWVQQATSPMTVDASAAGGALSFDFSAIGVSLHFIGGALSTHIIGGSAADTFDGGTVSDIFSGNGGNDTFNFGPSFSPDDQIDGGTGSDTLTLNGDFSAAFTFAAATMTNVETLRLAAGGDYNLATNDGNIASGQTLTVDASTLGSGNHLTFNGGAESDGFLQILGGAGSDTVSFAGNMVAGDHFDGGAGNDTLVLNGDYAGLTFGAATIVNVETIRLTDGHSYNLTTNDGNVAAGQTLTVDASAIEASLTFNGAAETDGSFTFIGGVGNDALTGGAQADTFDLSHGGNDTVHGGAGNDIFNMGAAMTTADAVDGGTGNDTLVLNGDYSGGLTFGDTTITSIETLQFAAGHSYNVTGSGANMRSLTTVDGSALGAGDSLTFYGGAATLLTIIGGAGNDNLTGSGVGNDVIDLSHGGNDTANGSGGNDTFIMGATLTAADSIDGGTGTDTVVLGGDYSSGVTFTSTTIVNVEKIQLTAGHSYTLATADATVASGATLTIDASALGAGDSLTFNGSAETDGQFVIITGAGNDVLTGGAESDQFNMGANFNAADRIDGGGGYDVVSLTGDYSADLVLGADTIKNVDEILLNGAYSYNLTLNDGNIAAGQTLEVYAGFIASGHNLTLDASAAAHGLLDVVCGASDTVIFGGNFVAGDVITSGSGSTDTLVLNGDYSAGLTFGAQTITNLGTLRLLGGHSYNLTTNLGTIASNTTMTVDASALGTGDTLIFNGAAESGGTLHLVGGAGSDVLQMGAKLTVSDQFNGGGGNDTLALNGDYSAGFTFGAATITNVETIQLAAGHSYTLTTNDANVGSGQTLTVDASALGTSDIATVNFTAETDAAVGFQGGAGNDVVTLGSFVSASSQFNGGAGNDVFILGNVGSVASLFNGGAGNDTLTFNAGGTETIAADTLTSIETLSFASGHSYSLTLDDGNVAAGATLAINSSALAVGTGVTIDLSADSVGTYAFTGGAGNDTIDIGANLTVADTFTGGGGSNTLVLDGDYSSGFTFGATTISDITIIRVMAGYSYNLTINNANLSGISLTVDGSQLGASDVLTFNGAAAVSAQMDVNGGAGNDVITTGGGSDFIDISQGGVDTVHAGAGSDRITLDRPLAAGDVIDGGTGSDQLFFTGDYSQGFTFQPSQLVSIESIEYFGTTSIKLALPDVDVGAGQMLTFTTNLLPAAATLTFDGSAETDGYYDIVGGAGNDSFTMGAELKHQDDFDGGAGTDTLFLNGDYSTNLFLGSIMNVEILSLAGGHSYYLTSNNQMVASGQTMTVDASGLGGSDVLTFVGSSETDGRYNIVGGAGNDVLTGSAFGNTFDLSLGGSDTVHGGAGADTFNLGAALTAGDVLSGGGGADVLNLNGDYSAGVVFGATTVTAIPTITVAAGHNYNLTTNDATVASGTHMTVDASALGAGDSLTFNGAAETNGTFIFLAGAGADALTGGSGNDTFNFGANLSFADFVNGGAGSDTVNIAGEYTGAAALTLGGGDFLNIESLILGAGHSYAITVDDTVVAAGGLMTIDGGTNNVTQLVFNGAAETDGAFHVIGGSGNDTITTGAGNDLIDISKGGNDTVSAGAGDDTISVLTGYTSADSIDGGAGNDLVQITSSLSGTVSNIFNVEHLQLTGSTINITLADAVVAAGATMTIDCSQSANGAAVNASAETDGAYVMIGTSHNDTLTGGAGNDVITGGGGADTIVAAAGGNDTFVYTAVGDSTSTTYDTVLNVDFGRDLFKVSTIGAVTGVDTAVTTGLLSANIFDTKLAQDIGAGQLAAHHAVLFTPDSGTLAGHTFLIVDENGTAGYQAGADLVIEVTGAAGTLTTSDFI